MGWWLWEKQTKLTSGPNVVAMTPTLAQEEKGTRLALAESQAPSRMGGEVRVFFPSGDEGEAFAAGAVAKHVREKTTDKAWRGINGKEILMTEEGLIITCKDQEIYIDLSDEKGINIVSSRNINVTSGANITLSAGKILKIVAEKEVVLGTAEAHINVRQDGINITGQEIVLA